MHSHSWSVQVSCLAMIECVHAARCRRIIPRRLVGERCERERIEIHKRGRQSPRVRHWLGGAVVVLVVVKFSQVSEEMIGSQYIVVFVLDWLIGREHCCDSEQSRCGRLFAEMWNPPKQFRYVPLWYMGIRQCITKASRSLRSSRASWGGSRPYFRKAILEGRVKLLLRFLGRAPAIYSQPFFNGKTLVIWVVVDEPFTKHLCLMRVSGCWPGRLKSNQRTCNGE
jgi:hypothetical protein